MLALDVAFLTVGDAIRPALPFYVFEAGIIIWKFAVEIGQRVEQIFRNPLFGLAFRLILRDRGHCFTCIHSRDSFLGVLRLGNKGKLAACDPGSGSSPGERARAMK